MTVTMTAKNQITIPKRITDVLHLRKGSLFNVEIHKNRIELVPLETKEIEFPDELYEKLESLSMKEKGKEKQITKRFIARLKEGKV